MKRRIARINPRKDSVRVVRDATGNIVSLSFADARANGYTSADTISSITTDAPAPAPEFGMIRDARFPTRVLIILAGGARAHPETSLGVGRNALPPELRDRIEFGPHYRPGDGTTIVPVSFPKFLTDVAIRALVALPVVTGFREEHGAVPIYGTGAGEKIKPRRMHERRHYSERGAIVADADGKRELIRKLV